MSVVWCVMCGANVKASAREGSENELVVEKGESESGLWTLDTGQKHACKKAPRKAGIGRLGSATQGRQSANLAGRQGTLHLQLQLPN